MLEAEAIRRLLEAELEVRGRRVGALPKKNLR
jgi:hypothetical protein